MMLAYDPGTSFKAIRFSKMAGCQCVTFAPGATPLEIEFQTATG
jgi:hypothetical protein